MDLGLERRKHFCPRRVGRRLYPKPGAPGVADKVRTIDLDPIPSPKSSHTRVVEADRDRVLQANFATAAH
jgi:hypothetical protein